MNYKKFIPIQAHELPKFLLTSFMMVLTLYIYSIVRNAKDAIIISNVGAELISTLKLFGVLPFAIIFMVAYTKIIDYLNRVTTYHVVNWFFMSFFIVFDLFLYPNTHLIHFDLSNMIAKLPALKYFFVMVENWSYSLFYIMSELWGSMMLSLMFWQLANQIYSINDAKKFYSLFGFVGQIGLFSAGSFMMLFTKTGTTWQTSLHYITSSILLSGILLSIALFVLGNYLVGNDTINGTQTKSKKKKPGLVESLKYVFSSKYIGLIALLVICYGISINLVEGVWKKLIQIVYPDPKDISNFGGKVQMYTALATFTAMLASSFVLRIFSWRTAAIITPIIILITGVPFFIFVSYKGWFANTLDVTSTTILFFAVIFGATQNVLSKAIKYSFFDPTKEMAYIPLDEELKAKGKAAADVIGGRLGKSGGAIIQWSMLSFITGSTLVSLAPILSIIFVVVMCIWFIAVIKLNKEFKIKSSGSN